MIKYELEIFHEIEEELYARYVFRYICDETKDEVIELRLGGVVQDRVRKQRTLPSGGSSQQVITAKGKYYPAITDPLMEAIGRDKSYLIGILSIVLVGVDFAHGIFGSSSKVIAAIGGIGVFIASLSLPVSILVGFVGRSTLINGCMNCGFKWTPAKKK